MSKTALPSTTTPGMATDLATLCQSCGLCCDGSLFGRVPLGPEEVEPARKNRLRVIQSGKAFEQPCVALAAIVLNDERRACSIYGERPLSCRSFSCRLYERHRREGGPLGPRLVAVRRVRELVAELDASGLNPADFESEGSPPADRPDRERVTVLHSELMQRLERDFARA